VTPDISDEAVEAVADAMYEWRTSRIVTAQPSWENLLDMDRGFWLAQARAALTAAYPHLGWNVITDHSAENARLRAQVEAVRQTEQDLYDVTQERDEAVKVLHEIRDSGSATAWDLRSHAANALVTIAALSDEGKPDD
jgi:hypothetical protein